MENKKSRVIKEYERLKMRKSTSDISMCNQEECPMSEWCWRFNAPPSKTQSWFSPDFNDDGCEHFWNMEEISDHESIKKQKNDFKKI